MALVLGPSNALAHIPPASDAGLPNPQDIHVLLIDDEQLSRLVVCNLLRKCEYKVTVVESGAQAIDALQRNKPGTFQLVLTDVMMPEVDGLDILRYVRTNAALAELPVIMMSANEEKDAVFEAIKGGAEEYLIKPVTKKELQNIWRYVWKRASAPLLQRAQSEPDLQLMQGSDGSAAGDGAAAATAGTTAAAAQQQTFPGPSHQQRQPQQQELLQTMQQLHRQQQQQVIQQPDHTRSQLQQQQQRGATSPSMLLSQWLMHPKRVANHRESIWLFCEVLLLLQRLAAAAAGRSVSALIRPSKLLLHHSGSVAVAAAAADPQEDRWYQSPEAAAAAAAGPVSAAVAAGQDSYSLGVLLFELLNTAPQTAAAAAGSAAAAVAAAARWEALAGLRQRRLPATFVQRYPQETALVLSLTHQDPVARLSLQQLTVHESLAAALAVVQDKHRQRQQHEQQQQTKDADATVLFLQTCHDKKRTELQQMRQHMVQLDAEIAEVNAALQQQQQGLGFAIAAQMVAAGSGTLGDTAAAAAAVAADGVAVGGSEAEQQQLRDSSSPATDTPTAADPVMRDVDHDTDDDDAEMERREQGRRKRRSIVIEPCQQQQQLVAPFGAAAAAAAAAGECAAAANIADVSGKWQHVSSKFAVLEAVYLKRKQQEQAIDQQQGSSSHAAPAAATAAGAAARTCASSSGGRLRTGYLDAFADDLWAYGRYSSFAVRGTVRAAADVFGGGNAMVNAAAFDRDDEFVATAGVSKRIRIFEYSSITSSACGGGGCMTGAPVAPGMAGYSRGAAAALAGSSARAGLGAYTAGLGGAAGVDGIVYPVLELSSRSRLCSVVWSSYVKAHVASSDVEGVVQLWDANTGSEVAQFEEHAKRAWAVDFSRLEPTKLVSCSDDCTVKVWSLHQDSSVATLQLHNNVCSVQFSPDNPHLLAAGCSNAKIYLYDLRQTAQPLACVPGHDRAVSYVRWLNGNELVTASIDNSLKLWSVSGLVAAGTIGCCAAAGKGPTTAVAASISAACSATYAGHTNTRNFIGLAVLPGSPGNTSSRGGYLACGSETNEVFAYHTSVPVPITSHNFSASVRGPGGRRGLGGFGDLETLAEVEGPGNAFVSCVTWNKRAGMLIAANSAGHIKVLELV